MVAMRRALTGLIAPRRRFRCTPFSEMYDRHEGEPFDPVSFRRGERAPLEVRELIERLARFLPPQWWKFLWLYHAEGRTLCEVAELCGVSNQGVCKALQLARRRACRGLSDAMTV
jgi:hypothetical protein